MRMLTVAVCLGASFVPLSSAVGGTVDLFFCVKSHGGGAACPGECTPAMPTLYLAPQDQSDFLSEATGAEVSYHVGVLSIKMDVAARGDGCGFETITSIGLDVNSTPPVGQRRCAVIRVGYGHLHLCQ